jgi:nitrite reductase/ring-hydroxylating ferredoxin subunit/uncharacterized membrane protein
MNPNLPRAIAQALAQQSWLDPLAKQLQRGTKRVYEASGQAGQTVKNFLHGLWLGHPLHPVLTDVPLGAFTAALLLDSLEAGTRRPSYGAGADAAVALGVTSGLAAAVTGLTDYQHVSGQARRIGLLHGLLNVVATTLYGASWVARRRRRRAAGRQLGLAGYLISLASAYLGGQLVFHHRIGVDHAQDQTGPEDFVPVLPVTELVEGRLRRAEVRGTPILLVRRGEQIFALAETCAHLGGPLSEGWLVEDSVVCPWHQSRFRLADGHVLDGPSTYDQPCLQARVRNGQVEVRQVPAGQQALQASRQLGQQSGPAQPKRSPEATAAGVKEF